MPALVRAQAFPSRTVTMVVPVPAGGALDTNARLVAEGMWAALGQPVVIENVTGASGSTGTGRVARSAPDGYTLIYGANVTHVLNAAVLTLELRRGDRFRADRADRQDAVVHLRQERSAGEQSAELIAWLKANPDKASLGTAGHGSPSHIAGVLFQNVTGTKFQLIPYRGVAPVIPDLVAGQIEMSILDPITSLPQFRAGRSRSSPSDGQGAPPTPPTSPPSMRPARPAFTWSPGRRSGRRRARPRM